MITKGDVVVAVAGWCIAAFIWWYIIDWRCGMIYFITEVADMVWHALPWVLGIFIIEQTIVRIYDEIKR